MALRWNGFRSLLLLPGPPTVKFVPNVRRLFARSESVLSPSPSHIFRPSKTRAGLWRSKLWLLPVAGGFFLYMSPNPQPHPFTLFASPTLIPCPDTQKRFANEDLIGSPAEPQLSIISRILNLLQDHVVDPIMTAKRFIQLFFLFLPVIATMPMLLIGNPERELQGDRWGAVWWYGFLVSKLQVAGPTFIKLGQWAATRPDLFPTLLCDKFGELHSRARPHPLQCTIHILEKVFQRPFDEIFEEFNPSPIGTGAIAQVYKAILRSDLIPPSYLGPRRSPKTVGSLAPVMLDQPLPSVPSAAVAVKVLHPRVAKLIARDLSIMSFFAHIITLFPGMRWISLPEEVAVFGDMMRQQLYLRHEAENLITFEHNFASRSLPVTFPRPLREFSTSELLVEEYERALPLELFLKHGAGPFDKQMATIGLDAFLNMLLLDNFVHADLHPGNIMVKFTRSLTSYDLLRSLFHNFFNKADGNASTFYHQSESDQIVSRLQALRGKPVEWQKELQRVCDDGYIPEIVFIDTGLVTTLNAQNRRNFLDLFRTVAEFDGYRAGQLMIERCRTPHLVTDAETFALKMQHIVLGVKRKTFSLGQIRISDILTDVLKAVRQHHVKMEGDFINTVISILLLEGIGRQLDPSLDLFKSALPILRQLGRQMTVEESIAHLPSNNLGAFLKVWVWLEARQLASAAFDDVDDMVKYGWLTPSI
ncbi:ABC1-domain-containing protein [Pisolithus marmoratus]|nr:ABC1-domain-containing protein [Pisolithus marmoratus]